jgi:hypothetical protein
LFESALVYIFSLTCADIAWLALKHLWFHRCTLFVYVKCGLSLRDHAYVIEGGEFYCDVWVK